jgi:hypothetical protein
MTYASQPTGHRDFEIAIIYTLKSEADTVEALFDKFWGDDREIYRKALVMVRTLGTWHFGLKQLVGNSLYDARLACRAKDK